MEDGRSHKVLRDRQVTHRPSRDARLVRNFPRGEVFSLGFVVEGEEDDCGGDDVADSLGADGDAAQRGEGGLEGVGRCGARRVLVAR